MTSGSQDVEKKVEQALIEFDELKSEAMINSRKNSRENLPYSNQNMQPNFAGVQPVFSLMEENSIEMFDIKESDSM